MTSAPSPLSQANDFLMLRKEIDAEGLMKRDTLYYWWKVPATGLLWAIGIAVLFLAKSPWIVMLDAVYMAFVYGQIGLLGHDAGHRQIFASMKNSDWIAYPCSFLIGISKLSWVEKHNEHHAHPNHEDADPDIQFPMLAFSEGQVQQKTGMNAWIVRQQGWLFPFLIPLVAISLRLTSVQYFFSRSPKEVWLDALCYALHFTMYFGLVFSLLAPLQAIVFIVMHQILFGFYMGMVFAPNHKGMPVLTKDDHLDFLREQVLTSRNIRAHRVVDFFYGGLNFQIEHHLFPSMPRNKLRRARLIVRDFCQRKNILYHETSWPRSIVEVCAHMWEIGRFARMLHAGRVAA